MAWKDDLFHPMRTTISNRGQFVLPAVLRQKDRIQVGEEFEIERIDQGEYLLKRVKPDRNHGLVELLLACPVKDWFRAADHSETTDGVRMVKLR
jgi:bifunctional DNA-binding transcriptional regulator/antitoxin component of YhaV-PrlF toxin-antitoxin module